MIRYIPILFFLSVRFAPIWGMEAPALATKAVHAYKSGNIVQARQLFAKAMHKSVIQANNEWIAKTVLNLAELEIQSGHLTKAGYYLAKLPILESHSLIRAAHWRKAQFHFALGRLDSAMFYGGQAASMCKDFEGVCAAIKLDDFRIRLEAGKDDPKQWKPLKHRLNTIREKLHKRNKDAIHLCEALLLMLNRRYKNAASLWKSSASYFRQRGMLPQMAKSICFLAVSQYQSGQSALANTSIQQALNTYQAIGLEKPGIRAFLLKYIFSQDESERDRIKKRINLVFKAAPELTAHSLLSSFKGYADIKLPVSLLD